MPIAVYPYHFIANNFMREISIKTYLSLFCFGFSILLYSLTLSNGFVWDDQYITSDNFSANGISSLYKAFSTSVWGLQGEIKTGNSYYRPMMHVVIFFSHKLFGTVPWGWHLINITVHAANTLLLFWIACHLLTSTKTTNKSLFPPVLVALLFASHPINSETVSWVSCSPELGYSFFFLLAFYLYIVYPQKNKSYYFFSVLSFFVATLFKEPALILPAILVYYDLLQRKISTSKLMVYLPYVGVILLYLWLRNNALKKFSSTNIDIGNYYVHALNIVKGFVIYLQKLFAPINLNPSIIFDYVYSAKDVSFIVSIVVLLCLLMLFSNSFMSFNAKLYLALIIFPLIPTFYLILIYGNSSFMAPIAERYLYLPSAGFSLLIVHFGKELSQAKMYMPRIQKNLIAIAYLVTG